MQSTFTIFIDTNILIQCKPLESVDWSTFGKTNRVDVIVSRPIQTEIDAQKSKGSGRVSKKARAAASLFKEALKNPDNMVILKGSDPEIRLILKLELHFEPSISPTLRQGYADDELVGIALKYQQDNTELDVYVMSDDSGPHSSSKSVGMKFLPVPEEWLLEPESDENDKRLNFALSELSRYKNSEPQISLHLEHDSTTLVANSTIFPKLTPEQFDSILTRLKDKFPEKTSWGDKPPSQYYRPSSLDIIAQDARKRKREQYSKEYAAWLTKSIERLNTIHTKITNLKIEYAPSIVLKNVGSRFAEKVFINFKTQGNFELMTIGNRENGKTPAPLPRAPRPPENGEETIYSSLAREQDLRIPQMWSTEKPSIDEYRFYWSPEEPTTPTSEISCTCELWRHDQEEEHFEFVLWPTSEIEGEIKGALLISINSSNMTNDFIKTIPVRINVSYGDTSAEVIQIIDNLRPFE